MPQRIQRRRSKGWKAPLDENGLPPIYVGRPSLFGNPWGKKSGMPQSVLVERFKNWLDGQFYGLKHVEPGRRQAILDSLVNLKGRNLMCWCKEGSSCHADVLLALAAKDEAPL